MKKILAFITISLLAWMVMGCTFTNTSTTTTTTDERFWILEAEFSYIDTVVPEVMIQDYLMPELQNTAITVHYAVAGDDVDGVVIPFIPGPEDHEVTLTVTLTLNDYQESKDYTILMLRDVQGYEEYLIEQTFTQLSESIASQMPTETYGDFTLPVISSSDASVYYITNVSRVYNNRFIYSYPTQDTTVTITARIRFQGETRSYPFDVVMKNFDSLPQIPVLYLETTNHEGIYSKDYYVDGKATLVVYNSELVPMTLFEGSDMQIRLRGNSTLWMPKKSYRIKFDVKNEMLFDYAEKDWVLLANFADQSLIRNYIAYHFADSLDMDFTPQAEFIDVYLNGEYIGNYTLSDQIEVTNDRVNIEEHSTDVDTGYLIEFDRRMWEYPEGNEGWEWFESFGVPYVIKSPDPEDELTPAQYDFIAVYVNTCLNTLKNKQDYSGLIDEASFIDWFIVEELFKNVDSGYSSVYLVKDKGGLLKMGPVWDFDLSTSNPGHLSDDLRVPTGWYTNIEYKNTWYYYLMQYPTFQAHLKERWNEIYDVQIQDLLNSVYPAADAITKSRYLNFLVWDVIGKNYEWYTSTEVYNAKTYEEQVFIVYDYLKVRSVWMNTEINKF